MAALYDMGLENVERSSQVRMEFGFILHTHTMPFTCVCARVHAGWPTCVGVVMEDGTADVNGGIPLQNQMVKGRRDVASGGVRAGFLLQQGLRWAA